MKLDLTALQDAVRALEKSLGYLGSDLARDPDLREQFRAASIQAFEFTYEVAYKMLKRQLEQIAPDPSEVDRMTFMELIRSGAEAGLLADVVRFREYREKRNIASRTYNLRKAEEIVAVLPGFAADVRMLLAELERRNEALDESALPFKVDIVEWANVSSSFRKIIERDAVPLTLGPAQDD